MDKNIKELIDLNGAIILSVNDGAIVIKVYQASSQMKYREADTVEIDFRTMPHSNGDYTVKYESDMIGFKTDTGKLVEEKPYFLKEVFIWLLEQAIPYLAKIAKELNTEIILTQTFDEESKTFESYASLSDDVPVLFVSITPQ